VRNPPTSPARRGRKGDKYIQPESAACAAAGAEIQCGSSAYSNIQLIENKFVNVVIFHYLVYSFKDVLL
jgi:hypothetical protein